jgi:cytochrome c
MISRRRATHLIISALAIFGSLATNWAGSRVSAVARQNSRAASGAELSVWDGVYTEEQSKRGERLYAASCTMCHAAELTGGQVVPALVGEDILNKWNGAMAGEIFEQIRQTMPQDNPGSLTPAQSADLLAFIFKKNKFPEGKVELGTEFEALNAIRIEPTKKR